MSITLDAEPWAEWRVIHSLFCPQAENQGPLSCGFLIYIFSSMQPQDRQSRIVRRKTNIHSHCDTLDQVDGKVNEMA